MPDGLFWTVPVPPDATFEVDLNTGTATLQTEDGEVFYKSKYIVGEVGSKVECDRIDEGPSPRFQNCQPWN